MSSAPLQGFTEAVTRHVARGWVRDPAAPGRRVMVRAVAGGRVIGQAVADLFRGDVRDAGLGDGNCGFVIDLSAHAAGLGGVAVTLCDAVSGAVVQGSPMVAADPASLGRFLGRWGGMAPEVLARLRRMMRYRTRRRGVTVVARGGEGLAGLIASLRAQLCDRWELLVLGGMDLPADRRIRALPMDGDPMAVARHGVVLVVTGRVVLERDAVWHVLRAAADPRPRVLLWDFARVHDGGAVDLVCRPAFSVDGFCSNPDTGRAFAVRRTAAWGQSTAMILRLAAEHPVAHIPRVLHRTPEGPQPYGSDLIAVHRHLAAGGQRRPASQTAHGIATHWPAAGGRTLAIIPTRNQAGLLRRCLESLFRTRGEVPLDIVVIDHESDEADAREYLREIGGLVRVMRYEGKFDFSRMNNLAVARYGAAAETLLFLNNDTEAMGQEAGAPGWLERMRGLAVRPDVGAVGALLLYGDNRVQHAGVVLGFDGSATHAHTFAQAYDADGGRVAGYDGQLVALREVSAVTAACMMMRRDVFEAVGGFDEALPVGFNDTDLCLRVRAAGYRILQDGQTVLYHHESRTRHSTGQWLHPPDTALFKARHAELIRAGDPFYNPNLRLDVRAYELRPDCLRGGAPRLSFPFAGASGGRAAPGATPVAGGIPGSARRRRR